MQGDSAGGGPATGVFGFTAEMHTMPLGQSSVCTAAAEHETSWGPPRPGKRSQRLSHWCVLLAQPDLVHS